MNSEDLNSDILINPKLSGVDQEKSEPSPAPQQLLQHTSDISDLAISQSSVSDLPKSDQDLQHEFNGKNQENDEESCLNNRQLSNSMNLDAQNDSITQQQQQLHRSISHQIQAVNLPQQLPDSPASLDNLSVPNSSIFALMSKQQSRRDIKNTIQTRNSTNSGLHNLRGSLLGTSSVNSEGVSSNSSNSKSIFSSSFNQDSHKETAGIVRNADNIGSNSAGLDTPKKKIISLKKNGIKITNTTSTELKKVDFQDDDLVVWNEIAYSELSKTYDIAQNISIGIATLLQPENIKKVKKDNDQEMIVLPALVSVKTEEQIFSSFSNLDQNHFGNKISHFQGESNQDLDKDNQKNINQSKDHQQDTDKSEIVAQEEKILGEIKNEKIEQNLTDQKQLSGQDTQEGNEEGSQIKSILEKARKQGNSEVQSEQLANQFQNQSDSDSTAIQPLGDQRDLSKIPPNSGEILVKDSLIQKGSSNQTVDLNKSDNLITNTIDHSEVTTGQHYDLEHTTDTKISNILHLDITNQQHLCQKIESPRKMSQKEAFAERLSSLSRSSRMESGGESSNNLAETHHYPLRFPIDLVCVIDTSGSMDGEPLDLVKETLLFLVDLLQQGDRICLIQFSTNAKRLTPLLSIETSSNKETIRTQIQQLNAKGGTNITQGMQLAFDVLKQRRIKNAISSVFLLSDGLNDGAENRIKEVLKSLNFYQNYSETNFTIQTFGFGKDHDPNLMDKISQLMDGNFYYIEDIHRIDECFIDALGGLFSVVSQNVNITVKVPMNARGYFKIIKTFGDIWTEKVQYYEYSININQLISGVSKDFVFEIEIDSNHILNSQMPLSENNTDLQQKEDNKNEQVNFLEVELFARNVSLAEKTHPQEIHKTELLNLQEIIKPSNPSNLVRLHYLRVLSAEGLEKCQVYAHEKRFDEGEIYVSRLLNELMNEPKETQDQLQKLITDLKEAQDTLRKKISESLGWHRMVSCKRMYMEQRSTGIDLSYQNSLQKIMVQRRQSIKHQALQIQMLVNNKNDNTPKNIKDNDSNGHSNNKPPGQHSKEEVSQSGSTNSSRSTSPVNSPKNN